MKNIHQTEEFNSTIDSTDPVIIKFEADWCPDCKAMDMWIDPIVEKYNMSMGHLNENATAKEFKIVLKYVADQANLRQRKLVGLED